MTAGADVTAAGPRAGLVLSKLRPPAARPGLVRREALLARLVRPDGPPLVSVVAPGGFGKTTLLGQWAAECPRAFAWVTVDRDDDDVVLLAREIEASLRAAGAVDGSGRPTITSSLLVRTAVSRLRALVSASETPFVLVLDDVHELGSVEALDFLAGLARSVPEGSQLVLSGRSEPAEVVAVARTAGGVLELGPADLALSDPEAHALIEGLDPSVGGEAADTLVRSAEGWAAGLYLLALAGPGGLDVSTRPGAGAGAHRFVADYLLTQHLASLPDEHVSFLLRSSVLDRMSGALCDAALARGDSARMLHEIGRRSLFLVALDSEHGWYRYHDLFRAVLQSELARREPRAEAEIAGRASDWCLGNGLLEGALAYAARSGDTDRLAGAVVATGFPLYRRGQAATLGRWFEHFEDAELLARYPEVAALGAMVHALAERPFHAERWLDVAANVVERSGPPRQTAGLVAAVSALLCRNGPARMRADAEDALGLLDPFHPLYGPALAFRAVALHLQEDPEAEAALASALEVATETGATFAAAALNALQTLVLLGRGEVERARLHCDRFRHAVKDEEIVDYGVLALPLVADARTQLALGDRAAAAELLTSAQRLRPILSHAVPHLAVYALAEMARCYLELLEVGAARAVLYDAAEILRHRPDLGFLGAEVERLRRQAAGTSLGAGWADTLTAAELRLLPYLTTHLSFREIGERLFVSRNTVKTQAISIYRKLDATSRGEAVARAAELGLIDADPSVR